jgi:hypothetical protein
MRTSQKIWTSIAAGVSMLLAATAPAGPAQIGKYWLSGPHQHANLTLFLVHGQDALGNKPFMTLSEGIEKKKAIVHETGMVNQLLVENVSTDETLLLQAGDIVKGGSQDRVFARDKLVPPKSGRVPVEVFCVESGRWHRRGVESDVVFSASSMQVPSNALKLAVRKEASQHGVWSEVTNAQMALAGGVGNQRTGMAGAGGGGIAGGAAGESITGGGGGGRVTAGGGGRRVTVGGLLSAPESPTSLQLTLEDKKLEKLQVEYINALSGIVNGKNDVVGFAAAINGNVVGAEIYGSHVLFIKSWPVLLKASAIQAVAAKPQDKNSKPVTAEMVKAFLTDVDSAKAKEHGGEGPMLLMERETPKAVSFESRDRGPQGGLLRRSYVGR